MLGAITCSTTLPSRTASIAERPGLQQAIALIETGIVEKVLIPDVERLTANQVVLEEVKAIARRHQCQILPSNLGIDLCSDIGGLLGSIAAAGATYELSRIRNRQTRGTDYEQERNLWRGAVRFGFTRQDGKIVPSTKPFLCPASHKGRITHSSDRSAPG
jgi:DNA invertase Pin-like site-specific DNA recombinase